LHHVEQITAALSVPVQVGGGLRSLPSVRDALRVGAERVILGTAAYTDIDFLDDVLGALRERVIVSVDTRGGTISTSGWQHTTRRAPTSWSSSTSPRRTRSATRSSSSRGARPTTSSSRSRSAAGFARSPTRRRCSTPAPTRSA